MKKIPLFLFSLFTILFLSSCGKEYTPDYCFEVNGNEIVKFKWGDSKCTSSVIIPEKINDRKILSIKEDVFKGDCSCKNMSSICDFSQIIYGTVDIPDTIQEIGEHAFGCNEIHTLHLGKGVKTIGKYAFWDNNFRTVEIISDIKIDKDLKIFDDTVEVIYK